MYIYVLRDFLNTSNFDYPSLSLSGPGEFVTKQLSVWVVADLETVAGREVARNAFTFAVSTCNVLCCVEYKIDALIAVTPPPLSTTPFTISSVFNIRYAC